MAVSSLVYDGSKEARKLLLDPSFDVQESVGGGSEGSFASKLRKSFIVLGLPLPGPYCR